MADPQVRKLEASHEVLTAERCWILECHNTPKDPAASIARARVEPGVTTTWHAVDGTVERYVMVEGRGRVEVGELAASEVGPGDVVMIPAGVRQRITNIGDSDLIFYCMCTPRFEQRNYRALE